MNTIILIGNTGKDPVVKHLDSGSMVANTTLATSETYKNKSGEKVTDTQWHNLVFWGKTAEIIEKYVKKGDKIAVTGKITYRTYDDKDGITRYITEIVVHNLEMLGGKPKGEPKQEKPETSNPDELNDPEDDLPF